MPGRLRCVLDDDPAEVVGGPERVHPEHEDVDEVPEAREPLQALDALRQRVVVALRDLSQGLGAHRPLEVDVQLDLRVRRHVRDRSGDDARHADDRADYAEAKGEFVARIVSRRA